MASNIIPWAILVGVVAISLYAKGYFRRPAWTALPAALGPTPTATPPAPAALDGMDAMTLAVAFAKASKREAEESFLAEVAGRHHEANKGIFLAPFAAPAQPTPPPAAGP